MSQPHLICYLGRNGSGKSYRANQLVETQNYVKVSMADALRELAWKILGWRPVDEYDYQDFKNSYFNLTPYCFSNWDDLTGRQFLQNLGQGCKDLFGEDFWVKQWEEKVLELRKDNQKKMNYIDTYIDCRGFKNDILNGDYISGFNQIEMKYDNSDGDIDRLLLPEKANNIFEVSKKIGDYNIIGVYCAVPNCKYGVTSYVGFSTIEDLVIKIKLLRDRIMEIYQTFIKTTTDDIRFPIEVESAHELGATFIWCDYKKGNYPKEEHSSEALADRILASGKYTDGDEIPFEELKNFF